MGSIVMTFFLAVLLGELGLLGWWAMKQNHQVTPMDYFREKWGGVLLSGTFSIAMSVLWAEGALAGWISEKIGRSVAVTHGSTLASGFLICFFAHTIIWKIKKKTGADDEDFPFPPPPPAGA